MNLEALNHQLILLFILIFIGYLATKLRLLPKNANKVIADLVVNITCPATTLYAVATSSHSISHSAVVSILVMTVVILAAQILLAKVFTLSMRIRPPQSGVYHFMLVFSNCGFLGFPVVQALFGGDAVFIATLYNLIFQILCFTYGVGQVASNPADRKFSIRMIVTPMIITSITSLILYLTGYQFHPTAVSAFALLDRITAPASMLVIGCALASFPLGKIFGNWKIYVFTPVRLIVIPVAVWFGLKLFVQDSLILGVMVVLSALPAATNTTLLCAKYNGDESTAASGLFISTLFSLITLPVLLNVLF